MPAQIKKDRGDITLVAVLAGMAVLTAGIFAGNKLIEVGTKFFPRASDLQTQTYQQPSPTAKPTPVACSDSDGGKTSSQQGSTTGMVPDGSVVTIKDICLPQDCLPTDTACTPQTVLVEHFCRTRDNGQKIVDSQSINCPYGCSEGRCAAQITPAPAGCIPRPLCADGERSADGSITYCNPNPGELWCEVSPTPTPDNIFGTAVVAHEDAFTDGAYPDRNFGHDSFLIVDQNPLRESFLKFKVEGIYGTILYAHLFLKTTYDGSNNAPAIYKTSNNWRENYINHRNKPAKIGNPLDNLNKVPPYRNVWYDVTQAISGNGEYSFVLSADSSNNTGFYSRESVHPFLIIEYQSSGPTPTPTETPTPTASPTITPTPSEIPCAEPTAPLCENGTLQASSEPQTLGVCPPKYICVTPTPSCIPMPEECYVNQGAGTPTIACSAPPGGWCPVTPTPTGINLPDLIVDGLYFDAESWQPCYNSLPTLKLRIWMRNAGTANAGPFIVEVGGEQKTIPGLAAGQYTNIWGFSPSSTASYPEYTVKADVTELIAESDENNNILKTFVPIPTPPPICPSVSPTATITPTKVPITAVVCSKKKYGDANCDGKISGVDYSVWLNSQCYPNQGKTCLDLRANFNQDKYVDGLDFVIWLNNRGKN